MLVIVLFVALGAGCGGGGDAAVETSAPPASSLTLTSPAFDDGGPIPRPFTCDGDNVSPPLRWTGVPEGAVSLALVVDDPDAPRGTFTHWVVWGLPPSLGELPEGAIPGVAHQGRNGFGRDAYGGPCPPGHSTHHYRFELLALSAHLQLEPGASANDLRGAVEGEVLGRAVLTGTYSR